MRVRVCVHAGVRVRVREKLDRRGVHASKRAPASAFVWKRLVRLLHLRPCAAVCAHIARGLHRLCRKARDRQVHRVTIAREEIRRRLSMQNRAKL